MYNLWYHFLKTIYVNFVVNYRQFPFLTKIRFATKILKNLLLFLLLPYVRFAHMINNRSIAPIKASFIVDLDRLLLIDYCITNPAVIK
jgi:hypothetical protein